jgi:hypothetical protein
MRQDLVADIQNTTFASVSFPGPPRPIVDFRFADQDPSTAFATSESQLRAMCVTFVNDFLALLD